MTRDAREYLTHIMDACHRIGFYVTDQNEESFLSNELLQDAVIRQIEIVGEAGKKALDSPGGLDLTPVQTDLVAAYGMRNLLSHGYFDVDPHVVWRTAVQDISRLELRISNLIERGD
jgi:uncharacterized protein with HEPN domain